METKKLKKVLVGPSHYDCACAFQDENDNWFLIGGRDRGDGNDLRMIGPLPTMGPYRENPDVPGELQHRNFWNEDAPTPAQS